MPFVWLASYPKSGNTWVRVFLTNYQSETGDGWHWDDMLSGLPSHLDRFTFDEMMGIASADIGSARLREYRRQYHKHFVKNTLGFAFAKVHEAFSDPDTATPMFPATNGARAIYIVRNPLDLAASFAHHQNRSIEQIIPVLADSQAQIDSQGQFFDEHMGSWSAHVDGWTEQGELPVLVIRYEDLMGDPETYFGRIVEFCELDPSSDKLKAAIAASRFDRLKSHEDSSGFREKPPLAQSFFRRGKVGGWQDELTAQQAEQIRSDHGDTMARMGYL